MQVFNGSFNVGKLDVYGIKNTVTGLTEPVNSRCMQSRYFVYGEVYTVKVVPDVARLTFHTVRLSYRFVAWRTGRMLGDRHDVNTEGGGC